MTVILAPARQMADVLIPHRPHKLLTQARLFTIPHPRPEVFNFHAPVVPRRASGDAHRSSGEAGVVFTAAGYSVKHIAYVISFACSCVISPARTAAAMLEMICIHSNNRAMVSFMLSSLVCSLRAILFYSCH